MKKQIFLTLITASFIITGCSGKIASEVNESEYILDYIDFESIDKVDYDTTLVADINAENFVDIPKELEFLGDSIKVEFTESFDQKTKISSNEIKIMGIKIKSYYDAKNDKTYVKDIIGKDYSEDESLMPTLPTDTIDNKLLELVSETKSNTTVDGKEVTYTYDITDENSEIISSIFDGDFEAKNVEGTLIYVTKNDKIQTSILSVSFGPDKSKSKINLTYDYTVDNDIKLPSSIK